MKELGYYMSNRSRKILIATLLLLFVGVSLTAQVADFHNPHPCTVKGVNCNGSGPREIIYSFNSDTLNYSYPGTSMPFWVAVGDKSTRTIDTSYVNTINASLINGPGSMSGTLSGLMTKYFYYNGWTFDVNGLYEVKISIPGIGDDTIIVNVPDPGDYCAEFAGGCGDASGDKVVSLLGNGGIIPVDAIFPIKIGVMNIAEGTLDTNFFGSGFINQLTGPGAMYGTFSSYGGPIYNFNDVRFDAIGIYDVELTTSTTAKPDTITVEVIDGDAVNVERVVEQKGFVAYPNPFSDLVTVQTTGGDIISELRVYNFQGQVVKLLTQVNSNIVRLSDFASGTYFVELLIADTKQTQKGVLIKK